MQNGDAVSDGQVQARRMTADLSQPRFAKTQLAISEICGCDNVTEFAFLTETVL